MMTLKKAQRTENPGNSARILASVKLPEFDGSTHTIVRKVPRLAPGGADCSCAQQLGRLGTCSYRLLPGDWSSKGHAGCVRDQ